MTRFADDEPPQLTLERSAALIGAYRWVERELFEVVGSWVTGGGDPEIALHLDRLSGEFGWHAELWAGRLPVLDGWDGQALTRPLGPALGPVFAAVRTGLEAVCAERSCPLAVVRLAALHRTILPRLITGYRRHLSVASPVADGPTIRVLRLVLGDELEAWQEGQSLLQARLGEGGELDAVVAAERLLEGELVAGQPGEGLIVWPSRESGP